MRAAADAGDRRVEVLDVDDAVRLRDVVLHPRQQVLAAADRQRLFVLLHSAATAAFSFAGLT
jgi:hypothetical protein